MKVLQMAESLCLEVLSQKVLPWAAQADDARLIVARETERLLRKGQNLPDGMAMTPRRIGRGVAVRGPGGMKKVMAVTRCWPGSGLNAKRVPLLACTVRGRADLHLGNYTLHCPEGYFIIVPPGVPHCDGSLPHIEGERLKNGFCQVLWLSQIDHTTVRCWMCQQQGDDQDLKLWNGIYNFCRINRRIGRITPYQAVCNWYQKQPHRFLRKPAHLLQYRSQSREA